MQRRAFLKAASKYGILAAGTPFLSLANYSPKNLPIRQITTGPRHHFFGYIGQSLTIPWNASGNKVLALETPFHDHLPGASEPANVALVLLDQPAAKGCQVEKVDESLGWNHQQGTMFYWDPEQPESRFFFNDRDPRTGKIFTVLYDLAMNRRVRTYLFEDTPVANGGVNPLGGSFLAINYARMARLRPVTGYKDASDFTEGQAAPESDGIFLIDIATGNKKLLVSFARLDQALNEAGIPTHQQPLFINHTLWNRSGTYLYFFVRAGWQSGSDRSIRLNVPCTLKADGSELSVGHIHIGGHPEWALGNQIIGSFEKKQVMYDVITRKVVATIGNPEILPEPEGDISLSPDGVWLVNGHTSGDQNFYTFVRLEDETWFRTRGFQKGAFSGDLRIDPAPRWNRNSNQILVDGITDDGSRQMFIVDLK